MASKIKKAVLALEDGTWFEGLSFGAEGKSFGEVCFNTSMTGYQEILTDPSYRGQIVTMTYPLIGNYGVNPVDVESRKPFLSGFVVKEYCKHPSNYRMTQNLGEYLKKHNIIGIEGLDTRALTAHLRTHGAKKGVLSTAELDPKKLVKQAKDSQGLVGRDLVKEVTCDKPYHWTELPYNLDSASHAPEPQMDLSGLTPPEKRIKIAALDCGIKYNILRRLTAEGFDVTVYPATTKADVLLASGAKGFFLSNGPGDPEAVPYVYQTVKKLVDANAPIFGICLGHQMLGLALGGKTYKLKFGHRGGNQPVVNTKNYKVEITSQNHGFAVDPDSLDKSLVYQSHINLSDNTSEGLAMKHKPVYSVQYHPEASPGPHDSRYLFKQFREMVEKNG
ncbi:MAG TPA: glutamine-hydrolyzing carbamoyl-phosphate synthase small subunit [bacterium]|nr:glutamine-hydrolyzing carbamoyl-phosphate synthase small subunit [bacterium]